jgi:hypothetical protein
MSCPSQPSAVGCGHTRAPSTLQGCQNDLRKHLRCVRPLFLAAGLSSGAHLERLLENPVLLGEVYRSRRVSAQLHHLLPFSICSRCLQRIPTSHDPRSTRAWHRETGTRHLNQAKAAALTATPRNQPEQHGETQRVCLRQAPGHGMSIAPTSAAHEYNSIIYQQRVRAARVLPAPFLAI